MAPATTQAILAPVVDTEPAQIWFGRSGYVLRTGDGWYCAMLGDTLIGSYHEDDTVGRDVLVVIVLSNLDARASWGDVARAFRVSRATLGRAMQRAKQGGLAAVATRGQPGRRSKRTGPLRERLYKLFEQGLGVRAAHRVVAKRAGYGTVQAVHNEWLQERAATASADAQQSLPVSEAVPVDEGADGHWEPPLPVGDMACDPSLANEASSANDNAKPATDLAHETITLLDADAIGEAKCAVVDATAQRDPLQPPEPAALAIQVSERAPEELLREGQTVFVQHVGTWVLLVLLRRLGLYEEALRWASTVSHVTLRVVLDAVAIALAIGERCIEGVRRLETPSGGLLLRHRTTVTANWARRVLGTFADEAALMFRARLTARLLRRSSAGRPRVWLYVDNHTRRYTGKHTTRKAWRMQDKRAVPGTTDYYVHDEDGHPLYRVTASDHSSLSVWLPRVLSFVRQVLGPDPEIILSFDRGGAYANTLTELKRFEGAFVTFERRPYPLLTKTAFTERLELFVRSRPRQPIVVRYTEAADKNLRKGRGRVRRIAVLTDDGNQINFLTTSRAPAPDLIRGHLARWGNQENQFKHGNERWGINQLDGRRVVPYPATAVIPNPDRSALERKLALAAATEGKLRCELAAEAPDSAEAAALRADIERVVVRQQELKALRPTLPTHAPVERTSLAGKLVRHTTVYKDVVDTLRIAFANIEADLATSLAPHLDRPREAKKVVANLFAAPGIVRLTRGVLQVRLMPAATANERRALAKLLRAVNQNAQYLPGDPTRTPVRFSLGRVS